MLIENLKYLADHRYGQNNGKETHRMYIDQSPVIKEVTDLNGKTRIILVCGLGGGGNGYFCLDVTPLCTGDNDQIPSAHELSDMVLWEYPERDSPQYEKNEMGFSFSEPAIVKSNLEDHPWVIVFGNGYQSKNGEASLIVLDAFSGYPVKIIETGITGNNGLSTPLVLDSDHDGELDIVYAGDLMGNLWKFDLGSTHPHYWKVAFHDGVKAVPLFQARGRDLDDNGLYTGDHYPQPITVKPLGWYGRLPHGNLVVFGTGKYTGKHDLDDTRTQTLYGIWDYSDNEDEFLGACQRINNKGFREITFENQPETTGAKGQNIQLLEQVSLFFENIDNENGIDEKIQVMSSRKPVYDTIRDTHGGQENPSVNAGWCYDFPQEGERLISSLNIHNRNLMFVSTKPVSSSCLCGGTSMIYTINPETGGRPEHVLIDLNRDGNVNDLDKITLPAGVSESITEEVAIVPSGIYKQSIFHAPPWVSINAGYETLDMFLFMTADGRLEQIPEKGEKTGMIYWGEF